MAFTLIPSSFFSEHCVKLYGLMWITFQMPLVITTKLHATTKENIDVCETLMPSSPNLSRIGLTFDLDHSPTDLDIDSGHLLIKDYLPTKFTAPGAKRSWVISSTRCRRLTWPLTLTWISIGIIYSSKDYLPNEVNRYFVAKKRSISGLSMNWILYNNSLVAWKCLIF